MKERKFIPISSNLEDEDSDDTIDSDDVVDSDDDEKDSDNEVDIENSMQDTDGAKDATKRDPQMNFEGYDGILNWVIGKANKDEYRRATTECLAFGLWLRRFAEAELEGSSPQEPIANTLQATENESSTSSPPAEDIAESNVERTDQHG